MARGQTLRAMQSKVVSIRYVGVEPTYDISVDGPHHNFVGNGMIVHNSYNELSARYRKLPEEYYLPDPALIGAQSASSKQAREIGEIDQHALNKRSAEVGLANLSMERAFATYKELLVQGWPRELARSVLPVATYSHMFATVNLLNLLKFLTLRCDSHAQYEIRVYADAMRELIRPIVPVCLAAWESTLEPTPAV
jgi:thymidylate synthase (FAD)